MASRWLVFVLALLALAGCGARRAVDPFDTVKIPMGHEHYFLANGLEVVLEEDHRAALVSVRMRYHSGGKDDPEGKAGLAHLLEHLTFASGAHIGRDQLMKQWHDLGAIDADGATTLDSTDYWVTLPANALENALWLEAERMAFTTIDDDILAREKAVVVSEWRERVGNPAYGMLEPELRASLFPKDHPYRHLSIGVPEELTTAQTAEVTAFLRQNYVPDNATLIITGDFHAAHARELVEKHFHSIAPGMVRPARFVVTPVQPTRERVRLDANVSAPVLVAAWLGPPLGSDKWDAAKLALSEIGGSIQRRTGFAVSGKTDGGRLGSVLELRVRGDAKTTFEDLASEIQLAVKTVRNPDVTEQRASEIASTVFGFEDLASRTGHIAEEIDVYGGADYANEQIHSARRLTPDVVRDAVSEFFEPRRTTYVWIKPTPGAPPGGKVVP